MMKKSWHATIDDAMKQASLEFGVKKDDWIQALSLIKVEGKSNGRIRK